MWDPYQCPSFAPYLPGGEDQEPAFAINTGLGGSVSSYIKLFLYPIMDCSFQVNSRFITFFYTALHAYCAPECATLVSTFIFS